MSTPSILSFRSRIHSILASALVSVVFTLSCSIAAEEPPTKPVVYASHAGIPSCHMNMGPTGAKAWMRGYQFVVMSIDQGSPGYGVLMLKDVVTAADGVVFGPNNDSRITLGNAIGRAEADGKPLRLTVQRAGKSMDIEITLPQLGAFSGTWPADCRKSAKILDAACTTLINAQLPNGRIITDGSMGTYLGGLLLLASGDPKYLDAARRAAHAEAATDHTNGSLNNWNAAYGGVLLAEYYLATGDATVLEGLKRNCDQLARGQMACGAWGHTTPHGAYGALNQVGVVCTMALVLANECDPSLVDQAVKEKALNFFGRFAERGAVPYGDHLPYTKNFDSNGRNATCALVMSIAGRKPEAFALAESVAMSYHEREEGHTGGFFSMTWGPLAAALAGPEKFHRFMDYQKWYYNLARNWKGELVFLPYYEALTRFDSSSYVNFGGDFTTGGLGLAYALPKKRLRITGAPKSVFAAGSGQTGTLGAMRKAYLAREWAELDTLLGREDAKKRRWSPQDDAWYRQLREARRFLKASTNQTVLEIESNLLESAPYRASEQFKALKRVLGNGGDRRFESIEKQLAGQSYGIGEGKKAYELWAEMKTRAFMSWTPQGKLIKDLIAPLPTLRKPIWEPLSPISKISPQSWKSLSLQKGEALPEGWMQPGFDDGSWTVGEGIQTIYLEKSEEIKTMDRARKRGLGLMTIAARRVFEVDDFEGAELKLRLQTVRPAFTKVYLNGELIMNAVRGQRGGYASIQLDPSVFVLLKKGKNLLAVTCDKQGEGGNHLDVGLYVNRDSFETRVLPTDYARALTVDDVAADATLRVRETKDKAKKAWTDAIMAKDVTTLIDELKQPIGAYRHMVERALIGKGLDGLAAVKPLAKNSDWKLRAAYCEVVGGIAYLGSRKERANDENALSPENKKQFLTASSAHAKTLQTLLSDSNFWVRMRAASALGACGEAAKGALPKLSKMVAEPDPWVRTAALRAIDMLKPSPEMLVSSAIDSLSVYNSAYSLPRRALSIFKRTPTVKADKLTAVVGVLKNPPQGMGGKVLCDFLIYGVSLDPGGKVMVPVLVHGITTIPGFGRQQANPRGKAVELLVAYGDKAKSAIPALKSVLKDDDKKKLHRYAMDALKGLGEDVSELENKEAK